MPHPEHAVDPLTGSDRRPARSSSRCATTSPTRRSPPEASARLAPHRELGLTDAEYELIVEKLGPRAERGRAGDVLAACGREHCAYKHSKKLLRRLPTEGPHVVMGPGENAGAVDVGGRPGGRLQGRVAQPPERGRALPGRGHRRRRHPARRLRRRRAADRRARLAALRRARLRALALPARAGGGGHRPLRQLDRRADGRRRGLLRGPLRAELPRQRDVRSGSPRRDAADPLAPPPGPGNVVVLFGAPTGRDGIGGASVLASAELDEADAVQAPVGADRRSVRGEEAARVLAWSCSTATLLVALQDLGAAGLTSSARRRWRARASVGLDLDVARVPLREADMEPFEIMVSESQERMLCVVEPDAAGRGARGLRALGGRRRRAIGEVTDAGRLRVLRRRRASSATCRSRRSSTTARSTTSRPSPPDGAALPGAAAADARGRRRRRTILLALLGSPNLASRRPLFEQYDCARAVAHRAPARGGRRRGAPAAPDGGAARSPSRSTATGGGSPATRTAARSRRCSSARRTSPASAPSRSA